MTSKECELQLNQLIIDWDEDRATRLNATDIEAIKHLLLENQMQHVEIKKLKKGCKKNMVPIPVFDSSYLTKAYEKLEKKVATLEKISGYDLETLLEKLLSGQIEIRIEVK